MPGSPDLLDGRRSSRTAPRLLGAVLRHGDVAVRITEVEAYDGAERPGLARLPRTDAAQRGDVRPARPPLLLLHLRHARLLQRRLRTGGRRRARSCSAPARSSTGIEHRPRHADPARPTATWPAARRACAARSTSSSTDDGADLVAGPITLTLGRAGRRRLDRPAGRPPRRPGPALAVLDHGGAERLRRTVRQRLLKRAGPTRFGTPDQGAAKFLSSR